jgi:hypothetical protein
MHNMASRSQGGASLASTATVLSTLLAVGTVMAFLYYWRA